MKAALIYWIFGCIVAGSALIEHAQRCPNDDINASDINAAKVVEWVAVWPALTLYAYYAPPNKQLCKRPA